MILDARLDGFITRLKSDEQSRVENLSTSLSKLAVETIRSNFAASSCQIANALLYTGIPYRTTLSKIAETRKQYYVEPPPSWTSEAGDECISHDILAFSARIKEQAPVIAQKLVEITADLECFYTIELPLGVEVALWEAPVRLVVAYDISYDGYRARFDTLGESKSAP